MPSRAEEREKEKYFITPVLYSFIYLGFWELLGRDYKLVCQNRSLAEMCWSLKGKKQRCGASLCLSQSKGIKSELVGLKINYYNGWLQIGSKPVSKASPVRPRSFKLSPFFLGLDFFPISFKSASAATRVCVCRRIVSFCFYNIVSYNRNKYGLQVVTTSRKFRHCHWTIVSESVLSGLLQRSVHSRQIHDPRSHTSLVVRDQAFEVQ